MNLLQKENTSTEVSMLIIDTSILIEHFRKKDKSKTTFYNLSNHNLCITSITYYEILAGFKTANEEFITNLVDLIPILNFDKKAAVFASNIYYELRKKNKLIDVPDILIAGIALANEMKIATLNKKHFRRIKGLDIFEFGK
jgi:tRNA(fMet)-specific endonuclease VapC